MAVNVDWARRHTQRDVHYMRLLGSGRERLSRVPQGSVPGGHLGLSRRFRAAPLFAGWCAAGLRGAACWACVFCDLLGLWPLWRGARGAGLVVRRGVRALRGGAWVP